MTYRLDWNETLFFVLTLVASFGFGVFLTHHGVTDPFLYFDVAFVQSILHHAHMAIPAHGPYSSLNYVPGREMLMVQLSNMMGVPPQTLQFLPLGEIFVGLTMYVLCRRVLGSPLIACLVTVYLTCNLSHSTAFYSIFAYALALPLFFAFALISFRFLEHRRPVEILLCVLLFVAAHLIHYTISSWFILFLLGVNGSILLQKRVSREKTAIVLHPAHYLFMATFVIFLGFDEAFYKSFLPLISPQTLESASQRFLGYLSLTPAAQTSPYVYKRLSLIGLVSTVSLVLVLAPVIVGVAIDLWHVIVRRRKEWIYSRYMPFICGIVLIGLVDAGAYSSRGSISTKAFSMLFPLLTLLYLKRLRRRFLLYCAALILASTSFLKVGVFYANAYVIDPTQSGTGYETVAASSRWLEAHVVKRRYVMLSDLNLYGKYLVQSVDARHEPIDTGYSLDSYGRVVGQADTALRWKSPPNIVAIDTKSKQPTVAFVWHLYPPLRDSADSIQNNQRLHIVYDDGSIWLAKPVAKN